MPLVIFYAYPVDTRPGQHVRAARGREKAWLQLISLVVMSRDHRHDKLTVTLGLPDTGGLYRFSNVTYRGVQIGKVTAVGPTPVGAKATLQLDTSPKILADVHAAVRSMSAVGEQYVDLVPRSESGPYICATGR